MAVTQIPELPAVPGRSQPPAQFVANADAFLGALPGFRAAANTLATEVDNLASTASTKAAEATTKASEAASSATTATTKASEAASSASNAATSASNAATSASNAATSATNAEASKQAAATSATAAATSATAAATSATNAEASKTAAATSASNAATSATNAEASKQAAATSASEAASSASTATTKASEAASSASNAAGSASTATTKASEAASSATTASTKAAEATTKASEAASSATAAATSLSLMTDRIEHGIPVSDLVQDAAHRFVSDSQISTWNGKAPLSSPAFTGSPTAPTPAAGDNSTRLSTTAFVQAVIAAAISNLVGSAPATLDQIHELAAAIGNDPNFSVTLANTVAGLTSQITAREPAITTGTTAQYWRGDKTWATMPTSLPASDVSAWAKAASKPTYTAAEVGALATGETAAAATKLATARTIGGVSFDGTANINLPGVNTTGNQNTSGSAAKWTTARTITLGGDLTGSVSIDGAANVTLSGQVTNDSHTHSASTITAATTSVAGVTQLNDTVTSTSTAQAATANAARLAYNRAAEYAPSKTGSGASGSWSINITGNASSATTATKLATARTIGGVAFDGTANINLPGVNAAGNQNTSGNAATATKLQTTRAINGTNFDGSAAITTANWGTARTLTVGATGKSVNGSANVSWSLAEIGAQKAITISASAPSGGVAGDIWLQYIP